MTSDLRAQLQRTLGAAYSLERELGGGGMSRVFLATEVRLRRPVVVKVLSAELAEGVSAERFEREIQLAASLQQANIVPLLTAGEMDGLPYYTLPYVDGESLRARLVTQGRLSIPECVGVLRDVARALSYAHAHGVVHRDIKPENILLSHGAAVVVDFGIAKAISAARTGIGQATLTQVGTIIGTPAYMAPEQALGDPDVDHRVDLYAFGCVAYELLAGRPPFVETSVSQLLGAHVSRAPDDLRLLRPDVPEALAALVHQCLEKSPTSRPADADRVLVRLESLATPSGPVAGPIAARRNSGSRVRLVAAAGTLVVAALAWLAFGPDRGGVPGDTVRPSVAVMPLANLSGDSANNYFGEGVAEEITGALARAGLQVIGRGSARSLAARGLDARQIAEELGVSTVLQGTVQRSEDRLRISVTLVSGTDGAVRWTERFDREVRDIFAVQDEIARSVVRELNAASIGSAGTTLVRRETSDPEAHSLYLQGVYLWNRRTGPTIRRAIALFEAAVRRDPSYARAHAGIALAYTVLPHYEDGPPDALTARGRAAADKALALDSTLVEAWTARAYGQTIRFENSAAAADFRRAIAFDSTFSTARFWHSLLLFHVGRVDEGHVELAAALRYEPTSLVLLTGTYQRLAHVTRDFAAAGQRARAAFALDSTFALSRFSLGQHLVLSGDPAAGHQMLSSVPSGAVRSNELRGWMVLALVRSGRPAEARREMVAMQQRYPAQPVPSGTLAVALWELGERDAALRSLGAAVDLHEPWLVNFSRGPLYDGLRSDPRGRALLEATERM